MTNGEGNAGGGAETPASLVDALLVYAEPLVAGAHVVVVGDAESSVAGRLLELGARGVHVFDPDPARAANASRSAPRGVTVRALVHELEVRDGAFDLAVVPDLSELNDPEATVARLQRAVARNGAVVAMGRAKLDPAPDAPPFATDLGPAALAYDELYTLFARSFDEVSLAGVVPFAGVVFAELGGEDESPSVSVDARFAPEGAPSIFVVVARQALDTTLVPLDPYAIVQVTEMVTGTPREDRIALEAAFAAAQLRSELLASQFKEARERLVAADVRTLEAAARLDRAAIERDGALTRAMELETILSAAQQTLPVFERRLLEAEQAILEREDRIALLAAELEMERAAEAAPPSIDVSALAGRALRAESAFAALAEEQDAEVDDLRDRAERAESALAAQGRDLAHVADAQSTETAGYEEQLRDRARIIAGLEKELARREVLVRELVTSLEDARDGMAAPVFEASAPLSVPTGPQIVGLERKLDALAAEVARREGELMARGWRIEELENELARRNEQPVAPESPREVKSHSALRDELDALRQALAQEHAARVAAESGEELTHARAELARQAALLDQMRSRPS